MPQTYAPNPPLPPGLPTGIFDPVNLGGKGGSIQGWAIAVIVLSVLLVCCLLCLIACRRWRRGEQRFNIFTSVSCSSPGTPPTAKSRPRQLSALSPAGLPPSPLASRLGILDSELCRAGSGSPGTPEGCYGGVGAWGGVPRSPPVPSPDQPSTPSQRWPRCDDPSALHGVYGGSDALVDTPVRRVSDGASSTGEEAHEEQARRLAWIEHYLANGQPERAYQLGWDGTWEPMPGEARGVGDACLGINACSTAAALGPTLASAMAPRAGGGVSTPALCEARLAATAATRAAAEAKSAAAEALWATSAAQDAYLQSSSRWDPLQRAGARPASPTLVGVTTADANATMPYPHGGDQHRVAPRASLLAASDFSIEVDDHNGSMLMHSRERTHESLAAELVAESARAHALVTAGQQQQQQLNALGLSSLSPLSAQLSVQPVIHSSPAAPLSSPSQADRPNSPKSPTRVRV